MEMTQGEIALRIGKCLVLGGSIGGFSDLLFPLGQKARLLMDGLLSLWIGWIWLVISFQVCRGDIRLGYWAVALLGAAGWTVAVSRVCRPLFLRVWRKIGMILEAPLKLSKIILKKTKLFIKKLFSLWKKWVTIGKDKMPD